MVHVNDSLMWHWYICLYCSDNTVEHIMIKPVHYHSSSFVLVEVLMKTEWLRDEERETRRGSSVEVRMIGSQRVNKATASSEIHFRRRVYFPCLHLLLNGLWRGKTVMCDILLKVVNSIVKESHPLQTPFSFFFRSFLTFYNIHLQDNYSL